MGLISTEVEIILGSNTKYYEILGYIIPKKVGYKNKIVVDTSVKLKVKVKDLPKGSSVFVEVKCDNPNCKNPHLKPMKYQVYNRYVHSDGKYYCNACAHALFAGETISNAKLKNSISFAQWCIDNLGENFLEKYWDYDLNIVDPRKISYCSGKHIWIKCQEKDYHGSYNLSCKEFANGNRCAYCCNFQGKVHVLDSLGTLRPEVFYIWSDKNNSKTPYDYAPNSTEPIYWKCPEGIHEDYLKDIHRSNTNDFRCPECSKELFKGKNNPNWKGGISSLRSYFLTSIAKWKKDSMINCDYKCVVTGEKFHHVHHLHGFDLIMKETINETKLPIYDEINKYSDEELKELSDKCLELHYKYPLGVCLSEKIHKLFHSIYGAGRNTPEQFEEFKENFNKGKYKDLLNINTLKQIALSL